eukprot:360543-Chlamydomonas_euryale.AAC.5
MVHPQRVGPRGRSRRIGQPIVGRRVRRRGTDLTLRPRPQASRGYQDPGERLEARRPTWRRQARKTHAAICKVGLVLRRPCTYHSRHAWMAMHARKQARHAQPSNMHVWRMQACMFAPQCMHKQPRSRDDHIAAAQH